MNVTELLNFKPSVAPKRSSQPEEDLEGELEDEFDDDPNESYEKRAAKRRKLKKAAQRRIEEERLAMLEAEAAAATDDKAGGFSDEIMAKLEKADEAGDDILEETKLKRMILNFEKKIAKNQELRIKFPDDPGKFMSSELELHDAVQEMRVVATAPDLYPILVDMECVATLLGKVYFTCYISLVTALEIKVSNFRLLDFCVCTPV
jgi:beta-catenin-like protein 1